MYKKVVVIDDDELFRAGLTRLIDSFDGFKVGVEMGVKEFLDRGISKGNYHLVIVSPPYYAETGIEVCEKCVRRFAPAPVMVFSNTFTKTTVLKSVECGVSAYYTKKISPIELEDVMRDLTAKKNFSDIKLELQVRRVLMSEDVVDFDFTEAEEDVLRLVCEQKSSAEISSDLGISVRTVESRKRNMMLKTQSKNMIGVVMIFMKSKRFLNQRGPAD